MKKISPSFFSVSFFLIVWEIGARYLNMHYILPYPTAILKKIWILRKTLFQYHLPATLEVAGISILISLILGIILAILMDKSRYIEECIYPIIVTTQTIPITALAPVFILWFGYTIWSKILVAVIIAFFPVTITLHDGLKSTNQDYINLFKSMNANNLDIFFKLKIPSCLPYFFSSLKISIPLVLIGAAIGEWLGANAGLGYFSKRMMTQLDGAGVFAPIVLISFIAIFLVQIINIIEKKVLTWKK